MSAKRDYYEVLGVSKGAGADEIKSQYRKLVLKFHPDRNKASDAQEHFKEITEAYAVLSDPAKRQTYDQQGHEGIDGRYTQEDIFRGASATSDFNDVFQNLFGGGFDFFGGGAGHARGNDIMYETSITLEDVLRGKTVNARINKSMPCRTCAGTGSAPGTSKKKCPTCGGRGQVRKSKRAGFASFVTVESCRDCRGSGTINQRPCRDCRGGGLQRGTATVSFNLPKGVDRGDYRITGGGDSVPGGVSGDLIVRVHIEPHPHFRRDGSNLHHDRHISFVDAILGKQLLIPTLDGTTKLKVDSGTQPNTIIKIGGKGLPRTNSWGKGDLFVRLVVDIPSKLNRKQTKLLKEFEAAE